MKSTLTVSIWAGVALYAALGLFGIAVFHDATLGRQYLTTGYGVAYTITANSAKSD